MTAKLFPRNTCVSGYLNTRTLNGCLFLVQLGFQSKVIIFVSLVRENLHVKPFTGVITKEKRSRQSF